jgi:hypothetical protein
MSAVVGFFAAGAGSGVDQSGLELLKYPSKGLLVLFWHGLSVRVLLDPPQQLLLLAGRLWVRSSRRAGSFLADTAEDPVALQRLAGVMVSAPTSYLRRVGISAPRLGVAFTFKTVEGNPKKTPLVAASDGTAFNLQMRRFPAFPSQRNLSVRSLSRSVSRAPTMRIGSDRSP